MPQSKHRRKGRSRPRERNVAGPPVKPEPSPAWIPVVGVGFIVAGVVVVIVNYIPGLFERNWILFAGFGLMAVGFGFLMRYR
jgi:hypothetical protein